MADLTDEQLFVQALTDVDPLAKYEDRAPPIASKGPAGSPAPAALALSEEEALALEVLRAFGDVTPLAPRPKRVLGPVDVPRSAAPSKPSPAPQGRVEVPQSLRPEQEALLRAVRDQELAEIYLRQLTVEAARSKLVYGLQRHRAAGTRYLRIVTGKGRELFGLSPLKELVLEVLQSGAHPEVELWSPLPQPDGTYGTLIVALRQDKKPGRRRS